MILSALRVDATTMPALIFGGVLVFVSAVMTTFVWRSRNVAEEEPVKDGAAGLHSQRQFRRRMQVSAMLALVGVLIAVGDQLDQLFVRRPFLFFVWVGCVFFLVLWMVLMAMADWLSTVVYSANAKVHLRNERRILDEEIRRYQATKNGHVSHDGETTT